MRELMLGNKAVARGLYEGGCRVIVAMLMLVGPSAPPMTPTAGSSAAKAGTAIPSAITSARQTATNFFM